MKLETEPAIKRPADYKLIGRSVVRFDIEAKSRGQAVYGIDIRLPGMLYAAVAMPPSFGGELQSYDLKAIERRPGVVAAVAMNDVGLANGVAVVADSWWRAKTALESMPVTWTLGPNATVSSSALVQHYQSKLDVVGPTAVDEGDLDRAFSGAHRLVEAEYKVPHQAHAAIEPANCTALVTMIAWISGSRRSNQTLRLCRQRRSLVCLPTKCSSTRRSRAAVLARAESMGRCSRR